MNYAVQSIHIARSLVCVIALIWGSSETRSDSIPADSPFVCVLGIAQDAGFPQAGCEKDCCKDAWENPSMRRHATSLAICDPVTQQTWMLDCTPDFKDQLRIVSRLDRSGQPTENSAAGYQLKGILLTHAHIGHYAGLIHLGREVMGTSQVDVLAMPRMKQFLTSNGPWDQLVSLKNIRLQSMRADKSIRLNDRINVTPILVPHRDEYSETVGFMVEGPRKRVLYLPDIDKWSRWDRSIVDVVNSVDVAYLDGTFFGNAEIPGRDLSQIPHPFIQESLQLFGEEPEATRKRIRFIHLNHTNPALNRDSAAHKIIIENGCRVAKQQEVFGL